MPPGGRSRVQEPLVHLRVIIDEQHRHGKLLLQREVLELNVHRFTLAGEA
jgi:hypothetical protein